LVFEGTDPATQVVVELGPVVVVSEGDPPADAIRLSGRTVDLVEGLSFRAPFPCPVADEDLWLLSGLATVFDLPDGAIRG
jgi:hypothetical protein